MSANPHEAASNPFSGNTQPSIAEIARITTTSAVSRWSPPTLVKPEDGRSQSVFLLAMAFLLPLALAVIATVYLLNKSLDRQLTANPPKKSIYVAVHSVSRNFAIYLAHEKLDGIKILVVSDRSLSLPPEIPFRRVSPAEVASPGMLVDQTRFYPLH